jgi:hypothetical protein
LFAHDFTNDRLLFLRREQAGQFAGRQKKENMIND